MLSPQPKWGALGGGEGLVINEWTKPSAMRRRWDLPVSGNSRGNRRYWLRVVRSKGHASDPPLVSHSHPYPYPSLPSAPPTLEKIALCPPFQILSTGSVPLHKQCICPGAVLAVGEGMRGELGVTKLPHMSPPVPGIEGKASFASVGSRTGVSGSSAGRPQAAGTRL